MMTETEIKDLVKSLAPTRNIYSELLEMSEELTEVILKMDEFPTYCLKISFVDVLSTTRYFKSIVFDA